MSKVEELEIYRIMLAELEAERLSTFTWLNHASLLHFKNKIDKLSNITYVGIDGIFLKFFSGAKIKRSSADLVLPMILDKRELKIFLVGGEIRRIDARLNSFKNRFPKAKVLLNLSGFETNLVRRIFQEAKENAPNIIILGLGAPKQEEVALELSELFGSSRNLVITTCGGWLDQLTVKNYYPSWAYPLKLNWLVRLAREPRRLWRRYTIDAFSIFFQLSLITEIKNHANLH